MTLTTDPVGTHGLTEAAARQLATKTKSIPQWDGITPRYLTQLIGWHPVEAGVFRVTRVTDALVSDADIQCSPGEDDVLPRTSIGYDEFPREYTLNAVTTTVAVQTRLSDLYRSPHDQVREQLRLSVERIKERQEHQLINNDDYGLVHQATPGQRITTRTGAPTPDDLDELITKVWKQPSFFLAHPLAIAAFGRECTRRGVPPVAVNLLGAPFLTWRGIPIVPTDKLAVRHDRTSILLVRSGVDRQGVTGLFQPGVAGEVTPSLSVRFMGIDAKAQATYLIALYCSAAVLSDDALAVLDDVDVSRYHDYED